MEKNIKYYAIYNRKYSILYNDYVLYVKYIKTHDIYHYIGYEYCNTIEQIKRIDYIEIPQKTYEINKNITKIYYKGLEVI